MKLLNKICLAPLALLLFVSAAHAEFLYFSDQTLRNFKASNARFAKRAAFLTPNEHYPSLALPAFKESIRGVYISVGTERGFIGAAFSHATHLLLVDIHPDVAEFNRINILLLKACHGNSRLFTQARLDPNAWQTLEAKLKLPEDEKAILINSLKSEKWQKWLIDDFGRNPFLKITPQEYHGNYQGPFHDAHYVHDPKAFRKLTLMATEGRMQAENIDLGSAYQVAQMANALESSDLALSMLDLSNGWENGYIGGVRTQALIQALTRIAQPNSIVMITDYNSMGPERWIYEANTIQGLQRNNYFSYKFRDGDISYADDFEYHFPAVHEDFKRSLCEAKLL